MSPLDWELFRYPNTVFWLITYSNNFFTIYTSPRSPSNSCVIIRASNRSWFWLAWANGYSCFTLRGFVGWRWGTNPNNASIPRMLGFTKRLTPTYGIGLIAPTYWLTVIVVLIIWLISPSGIKRILRSLRSIIIVLGAFTTWIARFILLIRIITLTCEYWGCK